MELYNCFSKVEKDLKGTELQALSNNKLLALAVDIRNMFLHTCELEDEHIVIDALHQIVQELARR